MPKKDRSSLSVAMAVENLAEVCEEIDVLRSEYETLYQSKLRLRNELIVEAVGWMPITKIQQITGLSRERIRQLRSAGRSAD